MYIISQIRPCVCREIGVFIGILCDVHLPEAFQDLLIRILVRELPFQYPLEQQGNKNNKQVCADAVPAGQIDRPCPHFCLGNTEGFFYFPSSLCDLQDV